MLRNCLTDIENQSFTNYELVVVDDGSADETPVLLEKASQDDSRIRMIRTEPQGIVSALNTGLFECKGTYIARMDVDDRMQKTRLEKQLELIQKDPELELIGCRVEGFTDKGPLPESAVHYQSWNNSLMSHQQIESDLFAESPIVHPTFLQLGNYSTKLADTQTIPGQKIMILFCGHTAAEQSWLNIRKYWSVNILPPDVSQELKQCINVRPCLTQKYIISLSLVDSKNVVVF